jgi:hypothetical protein
VTSKTDYILQAKRNYINQAGLAQSVERRTLNPVVEGSSPSFGAIFAFFFQRLGEFGLFFPRAFLETKNKFSLYHLRY